MRGMGKAEQEERETIQGNRVKETSRDDYRVTHPSPTFTSAVTSLRTLNSTANAGDGSAKPAGL